MLTFKSNNIKIKKMTKNDLLQELIAFLNDSGNYFNFIEFAKERGCEESEIENLMDQI